MGTSIAEKVSADAYRAMALKMEIPELSGVVKKGLTLLYGPPIQGAKLGLVSFQGGGASPVVQTAWPEKLMYLDDNYKFGGMLRDLCDDTGLATVLRENCIALPMVYPQASARDADKWMAQSGPRAIWRKFSRKWTLKILAAHDLTAIVVFGKKASDALGVEWRDAEFEHPQRHMTFGRAEIGGVPAFYCHHLSIGCPREQAIRCFEEVAASIGGDKL